MLTYPGQGLKPDRTCLEGSFAPSDVSLLDCGASCVNLDTILEACDAAGGAVFGDGGNDYKLNLVGTAVYAEAEADCSTENTNLDTVFDLSGAASIGAAGNDWSVRSIGASAGAAGVAVYDDEVNKVVFIIFEAGVSTVGDVETAVGLYGGVAAVATSGTGSATLAAADDQGVVAFSGGADQETISVAGNVVTVAFQTGVTTVAEVETLIGTLSGAEKFIQVESTGTGGSTLTAADDGVGELSFAGGYSAEDSKRGQGFTVARSATGTYKLTLRDRMKSLVSMVAELQLSGASDKHIQFGDYDASARTLLIRIRDISGGGAADVSYDANNRISFSLVYQP